MIGIRNGRIEDIPQLNDIYNHYIEGSHIIFDVVSYSIEQRQAWFANYKKTGPHRLLVAEDRGEVLGAITSSQFRPHPAFSETVEFGICLHHDAHGRGVGKLLYSALFEALKSENVHLVVSSVALPNPASIALQKHFGFREVGTFTEYAKKQGSYISSTWFEKLLK